LKWNISPLRRAGGVGEVEVRVADTRVDTQAERHGARTRLVHLQLTNRVEDHLVGEPCHFGDLVGAPRDAVGVHFLAELLPPEAGFVERTARRTVEMLRHHLEHPPRREALQGENRLRSGRRTNTVDDLEVVDEALLVDEVVGSGKGHDEGFACTVGASGAAAKRPR
jgi:hypothetical protein